MADVIIACPSCGKKFKIAEETEPGQFDCTNCGTPVPYGADAAPARAVPARKAGRARPAHGGKRAGARARPAGRARRGRRGARNEDEYDAPPEKSNATLWIVLGVVGVLVVGGGIFLALTMGDDQPVTPPFTAANGTTDPTAQPAGGAPAVVPIQATQPNVQPPPAGIDALPTAGNSGVGGTDTTPRVPDPIRDRGTDRDRPSGGRAKALGDSDSLFGLSRTRLRILSLSRLEKGLQHLEDTSPELRSEIDKLCATLVDPFAGRAFIDAQKRLAEIGKPAVPIMIAAFKKSGDFGSRDGMVNACVVDEAMRMTVGKAAKMMELRQMANPSAKQIEKTAKGWAVWWFRDGHQQDSFAVVEGGDDDDEE